LIGRLDAKAHRNAGYFEIKTLHLEPDVRITDRLVTDVARAFRECAVWHGTSEVMIRQSDPPIVAALLQQAIAGV